MASLSFPFVRICRYGALQHAGLPRYQGKCTARWQKKNYVEMKAAGREKLAPQRHVRVELENATRFGSHRWQDAPKNRIVVLVGDEVLVELTPYDLTKRSYQPNRFK